MKPDETEVLINYWIEQAQTAVDDAKLVLNGQLQQKSGKFNPLICAGGNTVIGLPSDRRFNKLLVFGR